MSLWLQERWAGYIKKLEKVVNGEQVDKMICAESNIELYDILADKHLHTVYAKRPNPYGDKLQKNRDNFVGLEMKEQCEALLQILQLTKIGITETNLVLIGESPRSGIMLLSKKIKQGDSFAIILQSVTGLYERKELIF